MSDVAEQVYYSKRRRLGAAMGAVTLVAMVVFAVQSASAQGHGEPGAAPVAAEPAAHGLGAEQGSHSATPEGQAEEHGSLHAPETAHGEHAHPLPAINWMATGGRTPPFIALIVNFGILIFGFYYLGKKPVQKALVDRRASVAREIEEANRFLREAEERAKVYQAKLANLETEIETAKRSLTEAGKGDRDRILREAEEKAARMKRDANLLVEQEVKQIRQDLLLETIDAAGMSALTMLRERATQEDHERLANEFLVELAQVKAAKGMTV